MPVRNEAIDMYGEIMVHDLVAFIHRSLIEISAQVRYQPNWHVEVLAAKLGEVRQGTCKRLIVNLPPRSLKSHVVSVAFVAWLQGHDPARQILCASYAQDLSDKLARDCRTLMQSPFYQALFPTRLSADRQAVGEFVTTENGFRLSTSIGGVLKDVQTEAKGNAAAGIGLVLACIFFGAFAVKALFAPWTWTGNQPLAAVMCALVGITLVGLGRAWWLGGNPSVMAHFSRIGQAATSGLDKLRFWGLLLWAVIAVVLVFLFNLYQQHGVR